MVYAADGIKGDGNDMLVALAGGLLALAAGQADGSRPGRLILPFETGQLRILHPEHGTGCTASGQGPGYAQAATFCPPDRGARAAAAAGERGVEILLVLGFARAGERQIHGHDGPGRRLFDFEADIELARDGAISSCRIARTSGAMPPRMRGNGDDMCRQLMNDRPIFAPASGGGVRRGRFRLTVYADGPGEAMQRFLNPPRPPRIVRSVPPPVMMAPPLPPPAPPPPPQSPSGTPAQAIGRLGWLSSDDYPAAALRAEEQGTVAVWLDIGTDGRVTGCTISSSSGSASLDAATCRIFRSRGRFRPARNPAGEAVPGAVRERIRWALPDFDTLPLEPAFAAFEARVEEGGASDCEAVHAAPGENELAALGCEIVLPLGWPLPEAFGRNGSRLRFTLEISREGAPRPPFTPRSGRPVYALSAAFEVLATGVPGPCQATVLVAPRDPNAPLFDLCARLQRRGISLFDPPGGQAGQGRLILTVLEDER